MRLQLLRVVSLMLIVVLVGEPTAWGQRTSLDVGDIVGRPSSVSTNAGKHRVQLAQRHYSKAKKQQEAVAQSRIDKNKGLVSSKPTINVVQNLTLAFVDVNGRPVPQLPVSLTVRGKSGTKSLDGITGNDGRVTAQHISPLPAAVEISLRPKTVGPDAVPEWALKDPLMASVLVEKGTGTRVAEREAEQPYEVASLILVAKSQATSPKTYVYNTTKRVELVRNVVDLVCSGLPAQTEISWPTSRPGEDGISVSDGTSPVVVQMPASSFAFGSVPLTFSRKSDEGVFEAVSNDYPHDPYTSANRVTLPEMPLVALSRDRIPQYADLVLGSGNQVEERYPELKKRNRDKSLVEAGLDGSQWWKANRAGLWFKLRTAPGGVDGKTSDLLVECVKMVSPSAGSIAGIGVGDDEDKVRQLLGTGSETSRSITYLDKGLRFNLAAHRVDSIDIFRPTDLLANGTTAFVARKPASVYIQECSVNGRWSKGPIISGTDALKAYLVRTGVITLTDSPDRADYTLCCRVSDLVEKQDMPLDMIPLKYECSMTLTYSLRDNVTGKMVFDNQTLRSSSRSDFWEALAPVLVVVGVAVKKSDSDLAKVLIGGLGVAFVQALKDAAKQAAIECPLLVEQTTYSQLASGLYDTFDCRSRVTKIDYDKGTLTLNVGTADGVRAGGTNPSSFEILVNSQSGPQPLPFKEDGMSADYYAAEVVSADEHTCVCTLKHVKRWMRVKYGLFGKSFVGGMVEASDDMATLRRIPDPATGVVSARMKLRFLPLVPKPTGMAAEH